MDNCHKVKCALSEFANNKRGVEGLYKFFQAFPGGYGEGDEFIGVTVPSQRAVAKKFYQQISLTEVESLLNEPIHEYRLTALFMMVLKYQKSKSQSEKNDIVDVYLRNIERVNNWDLVDSSAHLILGAHLMNSDRQLLYNFAQSENLWVQRISIIATLYFIRNNQFDDTLRLSEILLNHRHDLIHKAVGWMLREVGKRDYEVEYRFLVKHYRSMPRTMLRYAIERFPEEVRQAFLKGNIEVNF
jgi:3-methyladenine DNA glycosylase AlkD